MRQQVHRVVIPLVLALAGFLVPIAASSRRHAPDPQSRTPVRLLPAGQPLIAEPGRKGATYFALEAQATRMVSRFADAVVTAERRTDGDLVSTLRDNAGNEIARLVVDRVNNARTTLYYTVPNGGSLRIAADSTAEPTLGWANRQARTLWRRVKAPDAPPPLEWREGEIQPVGVAAPDAEELEQELSWAQGLSSRTVRRAVTDHEAIRGRRITGDALLTRLTKDGVEVGRANWYPGQRLLIWNMPHLSAGYIDESHLRQQYGGWPFTPDAEWLNIQTIAFFHFKTLIDSQRFVAERRPGWPQRLLNAMMPPVYANEPGCDNLHWLDGTIFRYCCDVHDWCYAKNGCSSKSWWQVWSSWRCDVCNAWVVDCFLDGGGGDLLPLLMV